MKIRKVENVKRICARNGRGPLGPRAVRTDGDSDEIGRRVRILDEIPLGYVKVRCNMNEIW